jgi:lactoylglutathione lyase
MLTQIKAVALYVSDQKRSVDFYVDKLGFEKVVDAEMAPGARWIEVAPPGAQTRFTICDAAYYEVEPGKSGGQTLRCDDLDKTYEELKAKGVDVTEPETEPWARWFKLTDPDGHEFAVSATTT